jgi:hypothetical protein
MIDPLTIGAIALGLGGGLGTALFGGKKKGKGNEFQQYDPYAEQRKAYLDQLSKVINTGFPETEQWANRMYSQQLMPQIREQYETKRNIYGGGFADTPEYSLFSQGAENIATEALRQRQAQQLAALQMYGGAIGEPVYQYTPEQPSMWENLLSFAAPVASSALSSYIGANTWKNILNKIKPTDISTIYNPFATSGL